MLSFILGIVFLGGLYWSSAWIYVVVPGLVRLDFADRTADQRNEHVQQNEIDERSPRIHSVSGLGFEDGAA